MNEIIDLIIDSNIDSDLMINVTVCTFCNDFRFSCELLSEASDLC